MNREDGGRPHSVRRPPVRARGTRTAALALPSGEQPVTPYRPGGPGPQNVKTLALPAFFTHSLAKVRS